MFQKKFAQILLFLITFWKTITFCCNNIIKTITFKNIKIIFEQSVARLKLEKTKFSKNHKTNLNNSKEE